MSDRWSYADEVLGSDLSRFADPRLIEAQAPIVRPSPVQRPGDMPARQSAPVPRPAPAPAWSYADEVLNPSAAPAKTPPAQSPTSALAEPDAPTWLGRRWQDIAGKQDQRYKDLPRVTDLGDVSVTDENQAKLTMPNDAAYGDILTKSLGPRMTRRFKDANGYEIIGIRKADGGEQLAYVNRPGFDSEDVDRAVVGSLPFLVGGGVVGKVAGQLPLVGRMLAQGATGVAASAVQDEAASAMGSKQGIDAGKMVAAGAGGAIGEAVAPAVGALLRKFWVEPALYNKSTGTLTEKGAQAARQAGIDPDAISAELAQSFAKEFARTGQARVAGVAAETGDLGIPTTLGQRAKDVRQLTREQEMRDGVWGPQAANTMREFDEQQWQSMVKATMGEIRPGTPGMAPRLAPNRQPGEFSPDVIGGGIKERTQRAFGTARGRESKVWESVPEIKATDEALGDLWPTINQSLGGFKVTERGQPTATQMARDLEAFVSGEAPQAVTPGLAQSAVRDVNEMRKQLTTMHRSIPNTPEYRADKEASRRILDGYNSWVREAATQKLLEAGGIDPAVAAGRMIIARGISRRVHEVFDVPQSTAGGNIMKQILETADTPEQVVRQLFVGPSANASRNGVVAALNALKTASRRYLPPEEGAALMGDLKLAHWLKLVRNPQGSETAGKLYNPQRLLNNIRQSLSEQRTVWQTLYRPQEIAFANRIVRALENGPTFHDWTIKPNSSRSATTMASLLTDFMAILVGKSNAKTIFEVGARVTGQGRSQVNRALAQESDAFVPLLPGPLGAAAGAGPQQ